MCKNTPVPVDIKTQEKDKVNKEDLVTVEEASKVFEIDTVTLTEATDNNFGIMPISSAASLLGINQDTLYAAAGRYSKFPNAVARPFGKTTGVKLLSIFHKEFIAWRRDRYNPHLSEEIKSLQVCKINDLVGKEYIDQDGQERVIVACTNSVPRRDHKFCGSAHAVLYRHALGDYSEMGKKGSDGKGKTGPRKRTAIATGKRSKAAINGTKLLTRPLKRTRIMYV